MFMETLWTPSYKDKRTVNFIKLKKIVEKELSTILQWTDIPIMQGRKRHESSKDYEISLENVYEFHGYTGLHLNMNLSQSNSWNNDTVKEELSIILQKYAQNDTKKINFPHYEKHNFNP